MASVVSSNSRTQPGVPRPNDVSNTAGYALLFLYTQYRYFNRLRSFEPAISKLSFGLRFTAFLFVNAMFSKVIARMFSSTPLSWA